MTTQSIQRECQLHPNWRHDLRKAAMRLMALLPLGAASLEATPPVASNVRASQRPGTKLVDIYHDVADADSATLSVSVAVSTNGGASYTLPATSFSGNGYGSSVTPGSNKQIVWNAGADWNGKFSANVRFQVAANDTADSSCWLLKAPMPTPRSGLTSGIIDGRIYVAGGAGPTGEASNKK